MNRKTPILLCNLRRDQLKISSITKIIIDIDKNLLELLIILMGGPIFWRTLSLLLNEQFCVWVWLGIGQ